MVAIAAHQRVTARALDDRGRVLRDLGSFDRKEGGQTSTGANKHRPGGALHNVVVPGLPNTDDLTISRGYDPVRDGRHVRWLRNRVVRVQVAVWRTGTNLRPLVGERPDVYIGYITQVSPPDYDSDSEDIASFELTIAVNGLVG